MIKIVNVLSDVLIRLCERNDRFTMEETPVTRFDALRCPQITITSYLERIAWCTNCSEECFVLALIYIDRLIKKNEDFLVVSLNVHRLMITSIMVSAKFFNDKYFNNAYFGRVGGVSCKEMGLLEIEFLFMLNFNLYVERELFEVYYRRLLGHSHSSQRVLTVGMIPAPVNNTETRKLCKPSQQPSASSQSIVVTYPKVPPASSGSVRQQCTKFPQTTKRIHTRS